MSGTYTGPIPAFFDLYTKIASDATARVEETIEKLPEWFTPTTLPQVPSATEFADYVSRGVDAFVKLLDGQRELLNQFWEQTKPQPAPAPEAAPFDETA